MPYIGTELVDEEGVALLREWIASMGGKPVNEDVKDVAKAFRLAMEQRRAAGQVINIGSGAATQVRELVQRLAHIAGFSGEIRERASASPRSGELAWQSADVSRAASLLGWRPSQDLDAPLRDLWRSVETRNSTAVGWV